MSEEELAEALARRAGLAIALRDHRDEVLAAARRAHALSAALAAALAAAPACDLPPEAEPAPAQRMEGCR